MTKRMISERSRCLALLIPLKMKRQRREEAGHDTTRAEIASLQRRLGRLRAIASHGKISDSPAWLTKLYRAA